MARVTVDKTIPAAPRVEGANEYIREAIHGMKRDYNVDMLTDYVNVSRNNPELINEYIDRMAGNLDVEDVDMMKVSANNQMIDMVTESMFGTIQPIVSMVLPIYRKFLPKLVVKQSMPTQPAPAPTFKIQTMEEKYVDIRGKETILKEYFNEEFKKDPYTFDTGLLPIYKDFLPIIALDDYNLITAKRSDGTYHASTPLAAQSWYATELAPNGVTPQDSLGPKLYITEVQMELGIGADGAGAYDATNNEIVTVRVNAIKNHEGTIYADVEYVADSSWTTMVPNQHLAVPQGTKFNDIIIGKVNNVTDQVTITTVNDQANLAPVAGVFKAAIVSAKFQGQVSNELNNVVSQAKLEINHKEYTVGHGEHVSTPTPIEYIKDLNVMYSIDGALKLTDIMSHAMANRTELEAWHFLGKSYAENNMDLRGFRGWFDVSPDSNFTGLPVQWKEEIKEIIDRVVVTMTNASDHNIGKFVIYGNMIDMSVIKNVSWDVRANSATEIGGVKTGYSVGQYFGAAGNYVLVASSQIPDGEIRIVYYPDDSEMLTYQYMPYSFNIVNDAAYRNPHAPNIPSLVMLKRHIFVEGTPYQAVMEIKNNTVDGTLTYR